MKCPKCGAEMRVEFVRDDGCRYFVCPKCGATVGEETEEWFEKMRMFNRAVKAWIRRRANRKFDGCNQ